MATTMTTPEPPLVMGHPQSRISYRSIVAGTLCALALESLLLALGAAVGLTVIARQTSTGTWHGVGPGYAIWLLISLFASALVGGWVAAASAGAFRRAEGVLHGLVTWALATMASLFFIGSVVGRAAGFYGPILMSPQGGAAATPSTETLNLALTGSAIGMWGLFSALLLPLAGFLLGGALAARRGSIGGRHVREVIEERYVRSSRQVPPPTTPVPNPT
jgi:hypothetical protein